MMGVAAVVLFGGERKLRSAIFPSACCFSYQLSLLTAANDALLKPVSYERLDDVTDLVKNKVYTCP
jgi:hypothetical protein